MKKKTENMIKAFMGFDKTNPMYIKCDDVYYVTDSHCLIRFSEPLSGIDLGTGLTKETAEKIINIDIDYNSDSDYIICELPPKDKIKSEIKRIAGRNNYMKVIWCEGRFAIDARYLLKIMDGFNSSSIYVNRRNTAKSPFIFYQEDDFEAIGKAVVMPVILKSYEPGFRNL